MNSFPAELLTSPYALRALRELDLEALPQIFPESGAFGASIADRRRWLRDVENIPWGRNPKTRLVMEESSSGRVLAGFTIERQSEAVGVLRYGFRPSTAMTQIAGFLLAKEYAFERLNLVALRTDMIGGQDPLAQIHSQIGYSEAVRLREWWRDAEDTPRDFITYEAVNPEWEARDGGE